MKKINTIIIFILFGTNMFCQETCREGYDMINKLMQKSNSILRKDEISLPLYFRIQRSKRKTKEALKLAYRMLEENDCSVIDRIIELELKLGNPFKAEKIALDRLNDLNPNWRKKSSYVPTYYLSVLVQISRFDRKNSFYKGVRRNKGSHGVCGFTTYEQDVANLLWTAESLFNNYGPIFCLKFLQSSTIVINEDKQHLKMTWEKIYELLIQSMKTVYEYEEIKTLYECIPPPYPILSKINPLPTFA